MAQSERIGMIFGRERFRPSRLEDGCSCAARQTSGGRERAERLRRI